MGYRNEYEFRMNKEDILKNYWKIEIQVFSFDISPGKLSETLIPKCLHYPTLSTTNSAIQKDPLISVSAE